MLAICPVLQRVRSNRRQSDQKLTILSKDLPEKQASSTARSAVRLCSSITGFTSTLSTQTKSQRAASLTSSCPSSLRLHRSRRTLQSHPSAQHLASENNASWLQSGNALAACRQLAGTRRCSPDVTRSCALDRERAESGGNVCAFHACPRRRSLPPGRPPCIPAAMGGSVRRARRRCAQGRAARSHSSASWTEAV